MSDERKRLIEFLYAYHDLCRKWGIALTYDTGRFPEEWVNVNDADLRELAVTNDRILYDQFRVVPAEAV